MISFPDSVLSLDPKDKHFVGDRAVVITNAKEERVACGTLKCVKGCPTVGGSNSTSNGTITTPGNNSTSTNGTVSSPTPVGPSSTPGSSGTPISAPTNPNSGSQLAVSAGALLVAFAAVLL